MGEAKRKRATIAGSTDDPAFRRSVFTQAFEQTRKALDDPKLDDLHALIVTHRGRDAMLDQASKTYAAAGKAECQIECSSCCHQMVLATPFEVFSIARYLLDTKTSGELDTIKSRLAQLSRLPLDPAARYGSQNPCALLERGRCTVYEHRPSVCRTMLSASRAACEGCLAAKDGIVPYVAGPSQIAAMMQLGIDYALIVGRNLGTERVELGGALSIAINDFDGTITAWASGESPFLGFEVRRSGQPSNREMAEIAAKRFEVAFSR
jgi:Fe-S-cluster containining protein